MTVIYIVRGSSGRYDERCEWNVCWRVTRAEAEEVAALCQRQGDDYYQWCQVSDPCPAGCTPIDWPYRPSRNTCKICGGWGYAPPRSNMHHEHVTAEARARRDALFDHRGSFYDPPSYDVECVGEDPHEEEP